MYQQNFGGHWTEDKLVRIRKYLGAYATIMNKHKFHYAYIDAFAGTGYRLLNKNKNINSNQGTLFADFIEKEAIKLVEGSARMALQVTPKFQKYIFIEKDKNKINELKKLQTDFHDLADKINIVNSDANAYLTKICKKNWQAHRAVIFLDPFGMQIPWSTIELIAKTKAIDLWYLFPVGIAINRLLKKDGKIKQVIRKRLDETFGSQDWYELFYQQTRTLDLFGNESTTEKIANCNLIGKYFVKRLKTVFEGVAENPLLLVNSQNSPLYLLCFAAGNSKGATTAIKIAQHILKN